MKVILLERVEKLGGIGDVVAVKDGFGRNFLLPRHKALRATSANLKVFEAQRHQIEARNAEARDNSAALGQKLDGSSYVVIRQAGELRPALWLGFRARHRRSDHRRRRPGRPFAGRAQRAAEDARRA